jgi:uncharacterized membrane protein YfcA
MSIYLPVAEIPVNIFAILGLGGIIGFLSGVFGVGGGFLLTPILILMGVPPAVAVASGTNQLVGASVSGTLAHLRRGTVDIRMGAVLLAGGLAGSGVGVVLFGFLKRIGQVEFVVAVAFVVLLGSMGALMLVESLLALVRRKRHSDQPRKKLHKHSWIHGLPWKVRFRKSRLYISVFMPLGLGFLIGVLVAILGVGGGFIMVPAMIYLLGMPSSVVVGTSLFQIIFVTANATVLQATLNHTVDVVLAVLLLIGGVVGAQFGSRAGARLKGEQMRGLLALMILAVCVKLAIDLTAAPADPFTVSALAGV